LPTRRGANRQDNVINQQVLAKQLELAGCSSAIAANGIEALQALERSQYARDAPSDAAVFDVCLMDIEMPIMDGLTACHRIRSLENEGAIKTRVPLIAVTANARAEQIQQMVDHGFDDVLTKPFRVPTLLAMVEKLLLKFAQQGLR